MQTTTTTSTAPHRQDSGRAIGEDAHPAWKRRADGLLARIRAGSLDEATADALGAKFDELHDWITATPAQTRDAALAQLAVAPHYVLGPELSPAEVCQAGALWNAIATLEGLPPESGTRIANAAALVELQALWAEVQRLRVECTEVDTRDIDAWQALVDTPARSLVGAGFKLRLMLTDPFGFADETMGTGNVAALEQIADLMDGGRAGTGNAGEHPNPHVAWAREARALWRELEGLSDAEEKERNGSILELIHELEGLIAETPAWTPAAIAAQVRTALAWSERGCSLGGVQEDRLRNAAAALERMAGGAAA